MRARARSSRAGAAALDERVEHEAVELRARVVEEQPAEVRAAARADLHVPPEAREPRRLPRRDARRRRAAARRLAKTAEAIRPAVRIRARVDVRAGDGDA